MAHEWTAPVMLSKDEESILKLCTKQKLWAFLRKRRHEILDEEVRAALCGLFTDGARGGRPPDSPERMALAMLLQVGFGVADHEVPALTAVDRRWQMVLDCLGTTEPVLSQGSVFSFRERARNGGLAALLLSKTIDIARRTKDFDPKRLRALVDSSPLLGAGRVEDTFNLLGRAISQLVEVVAEEVDRDPSVLADELHIEVFGASSVKASLDVDWRKPDARAAALSALVRQFETLRDWTHKNLPNEVEAPPISDHIATVEKIIQDDTEPDPTPDGSKRHRIREGTTQDRLVSLGDRDMRHGRKSSSKTFNGYKRHIVVDGDVPGLIHAVEVLPANRPEHEALPHLQEKLTAQGVAIGELHIDRGYLASPVVDALRDAAVPVVTKPPTPPQSPYFSKEAFTYDFVSGTITCPNRVSVPMRLGKTVDFPKPECRACPIKAKCTSGLKRQLSIHPREAWYREMTAELATTEGRSHRRARIPVEHALARVSSIQGNRARFKGLPKNTFDLERVAIINNYHVIAALNAAA